jgi:DNA polymerase-3 subunit delta
MARPAPTFYVFHGADELTRAETLADFRSRLGPADTADLNISFLDGRKTSLAELRHNCDAIPFLAEKRLVIVEGLLTRATKQEKLLDELTEYLGQLPETTRLVFVEEKPLPGNHPILQLAQQDARGYAKQFDPPDAKALPQWISERVRKHGGEIESQAAAQLAAVVGADLRLLDQEVIKLVTYVNAERPITTVDVDKVVPYAQTAVIFDLVDALGRRDGRTAAQTLHSLLDAGEHPLGLLSMIVRQFRLLIQVKELKTEGANPQTIAKELGIHPFPARKLHNQAAYFTTAQLEVVYRHLLETDVGIKSGEIEADVALDLLIAGLAATD